MGTVYLAIGIHNHQPVGNFDFVFEDAYQRAYLPFLEALERHPGIRLAQHYTGILLEWIEKHHPDFLERLASLVKRGQVEMMTGGFYEPILPIIPDRDKLGQIRKLTGYIREHFGVTPRGLWLAERVWEPHLPRPLREAGVEYVVIDDSHLKYSGLREEDLDGYFLTEEAGYPVNIFPIAERLRYTIPFRPVQETLDFLGALAEKGGSSLAVFADDGEKFGVWPGTFKHCYRDGWIERFFKALEGNSSWIKLVHFSEALDSLKPAGRVYLPTASYREMMEWALPAKAIHEYEDFEDRLKEYGLFDRYKVFVRGGFWRNFLAKYEESNHLHKKMLYVSRKVKDAASRFGEAEAVLKARDHLWAGQCNCPYWHGVFGGLYLTNLRYAVYHELILAEKELEGLEHRGEESWVRKEELDFDGDGHRELVVETPVLNLVFSPQHGGSLVELDYKPTAINLLDTMTRREEGYHRKLLQLAEQKRQGGRDGVTSIHDLLAVKEQGLERKLVYDWYRRVALIDHFLNPNTTLEAFSRSQYGEDGDFVLEPYTFETTEEGGRVTVELRRSGTVWVNGKACPVALRKAVTVRPDAQELDVRIRIKNEGQGAVRLWYGSEWNFALLAGKAPDRYFEIPGRSLRQRHLASVGAEPEVEEIDLVDEWQGLKIRVLLSPEAEVWRFPVESVSMSEAGFERVYQSSVVMPLYRLEMAAGQAVEIEMRFVFESLK